MEYYVRPSPPKLVLSIPAVLMHLMPWNGLLLPAYSMIVPSVVATHTTAFTRLRPAPLDCPTIGRAFDSGSSHPVALVTPDMAGLEATLVLAEVPTLGPRRVFCANAIQNLSDERRYQPQCRRQMLPTGSETP
jgi:hypothetical protein